MFFGNARFFRDISDAFAVCRECNRPMVVRTGDAQHPETQRVWKVYPSGRAELMHVTPSGRIAPGARL